jgi:acyl carrier protein
MTALQDTLSGILMVDAGTLPPATALRDIEGWDSLRHVMLVVGLEERFGVKLSAEEIMAMVTVGDIDRVLRTKGVDV